MNEEEKKRNGDSPLQGALPSSCTSCIEIPRSESARPNRDELRPAHSSIHQHAGSCQHKEWFAAGASIQNHAAQSVPAVHPSTANRQASPPAALLNPIQSNPIQSNPGFLFIFFGSNRPPRRQCAEARQIDVMYSPKKARAVLPNPTQDKLAVLLNKQGLQGAAASRCSSSSTTFSVSYPPREVRTMRPVSSISKLVLSVPRFLSGCFPTSAKPLRMDKFCALRGPLTTTAARPSSCARADPRLLSPATDSAHLVRRLLPRRRGDCKCWEEKAPMHMYCVLPVRHRRSTSLSSSLVRRILRRSGSIRLLLRRPVYLVRRLLDRGRHFALERLASLDSSSVKARQAIIERLTN